MIREIGVHEKAFRIQGPKPCFSAVRSGFDYLHAKNRYGMEHICHHHPNSMLIGWLLIALALTIERLYRLRYLHRGSHPVKTAIQLVRLLWFSLDRNSTANTT